MTLRQFLVNDNQFNRVDRVFYQRDLSSSHRFEEIYLSIREKEGRIYSDETVAKLPFVDRTHPLRKEWCLRQKSARRLVNYFHRIMPGSILEVGCGNGWLCGLLAKETTADVIGIDVNEHELVQAARIFNTDNVSFIYGDVLSSMMLPKFDSIVLASCIQYFSDLKFLVDKLTRRLTPNGMIHIIDSPLYHPTEVSAARERSRKYFENYGIESEFYYHHCWDELKSIDYQIAYDPKAFMQRLRSVVAADSPFPWIIIRK